MEGKRENMGCNTHFVRPVFPISAKAVDLPIHSPCTTWYPASGWPRGYNAGGIRGYPTVRVPGRLANETTVSKFDANAFD